MVHNDPETVLLYKRGSWRLDAHIGEDEKLVIIDGNTEGEMHFILPKSEVPRLHKFLKRKTKLPKTTHVLAMLETAFADTDKNRIEEIKVFYNDHGLKWRSEFWGLN